MTATALADLPLGFAVVLGVLAWVVGRVLVALIESRTVRRACRMGELLHHVDALGVKVGDAGTQVRDEVRRVREAIERSGGAR
jgi:hypothetical protein